MKNLLSSIVFVPFRVRNLEEGISFEEKLCCYVPEKRDDIYVNN